jgi:hypothetical protein
LTLAVDLGYKLSRSLKLTKGVIMIYELKNISDLPGQSDGVYKIENVKLSLYVVCNGAYTMVGKAYWNVIKAELVNLVTPKDLISLAEKFNTSEILQLKKEGLI